MRPTRFGSEILREAARLFAFDFAENKRNPSRVLDGFGKSRPSQNYSRLATFSLLRAR
jgi:hypothetical protein